MKPTLAATESGTPLPVRTDIDDLLVARIRAGLWILLVACILFGAMMFQGDRTHLLPLTLVKVVQLGTVLGMFWAFHYRPAARRSILLGLVTVMEVSITTAISGVISGEVASIFVLLTIICMGTASLIPWGHNPQIATVAIAGAAIGLNVAGVGGGWAPLLPFLIATTLAAITSIYIAYEFERHRVARREALDQLHESEARSRAIVDSALDCIVTMDDEGRIVEFNPAAERTFGYVRAEVIGRQLADVIIPPQLRELHHGGLQRYRETGEGPVLGRRVEVIGMRADGTEFPVELAITRVESSHAPVFTGYLRDLTERKLAQQARASAVLARIGREMMSSLDTLRLLDRLCVLTTEALACDSTYALLWNAATDTYVRAAASPPAPSDGRVFTANALGPLEHHLRGPGLVCAPGEDGSDGVVPSVLRWGEDGSAILCAPLWRDNDTLAGILVAANRVDAGSFSAEQQTIASGIAQIASLALTHARLVEELEHASQIKSEFLSTMSHELRTPLNAILGYAEMVGDDDCEATEQRACLDRIKGAGRDLLEMVESTLEIGRIEAGATAVLLEPVPLPRIWEEIRERCATLRRHPEVGIEWRPAPDLAVITDERKLAVIVRNLVDNALKFTERGHVRVEAAVHQHALVIEVEDTGIGIRAEDQEKIFELFRQLDGSDSRRYGGTGLGLHIVRRFAEQLGGTVAMRSTPGKGSLFSVVLPRPETRAVQAA